MTTTYIIVQFISAGFAFAAGVFWFLASVDKSPNKIMKGIEDLGGPDYFGSHQVQLVAAVTRQSKMNAKAAACATAAALSQGLAALLPVIS